ncbi:MAG: diaminopropionate ammonia-lyase [Nakamurella sp.]
MTYELFAPGPDRAVPATEVRGDRGDPLAFHQGMPGYLPTPLLDCPGLAAAMGVRTVLVKDESSRLGLPSFKMLGASFATARAIQREWLGRPGEALTLDGTRAALAGNGGRRLVAATDGNHGRGVARMARILGLACTIFVPAGTAQSRIDDIETEGAAVHVVPGTYDDAIARSAVEAADDSLVISDTSWEGYTRTPVDVTYGYSTMFREIDQALARAGRPVPDVVCFQAGVGSFAAAGLQHFRPDPRARSPRTVIVEPAAANCLMRSARQGLMTPAPGPHPSTMAGLNCGLPSIQAWPIVFAAADAYLAVDDESAHRAMRLMAEAGVVAGESGAASLGALIDASTSDADRRTLGLDPQASVLVVNTEGATDPVNYRRQVGTDASDVARTGADRRLRTGVVTL